MVDHLSAFPNDTLAVVEGVEEGKVPVDVDLAQRNSNAADIDEGDWEPEGELGNKEGSLAVAAVEAAARECLEKDGKSLEGKLILQGSHQRLL